jgi:DNA-binding XRE family transcriptional regulator
VQGHVKTPHIEINVKGDEYRPLIDFLIQDFGEKNVDIIDDSDELSDELINISQTEWFHSTDLSPGETVGIHRKNLKMTQAELGRRLGGMSRQHVSDIENGQRNISVTLSKKLAEVLGHNYRVYL